MVSLFQICSSTGSSSRCALLNRGRLVMLSVFCSKPHIQTLMTNYLGYIQSNVKIFQKLYIITNLCIIAYV
jgi:hypothetical protein